ncbi:hypothetical protein EV426DRAFT_700479 [Tirmania nivea]|nr:hypothetical protein EV426DRAFT_700479 [Tirmania nivea]
MQSKILSHFGPILVAKLSKPLKQPSDPHPGGDPHPGDVWYCHPNLNNHEKCIDAATDIYAMGTTFCEMLCLGEFPCVKDVRAYQIPEHVKNVRGMEEVVVGCWKGTMTAKDVKGVAEEILREVVEPDAKLRWMSGNDAPGRAVKEVQVAELNTEEVTAWSDGLWQEEVTAAAIVDGGEAGESGVSGLFSHSDGRGDAGGGKSMAVGEDSGGTRQPGGHRPLANLCYEQPRSWIEEEAAAEMAKEGRTVIWVKVHSGVEGNERADRKAKHPTGLSHGAPFQAVEVEPGGVAGTDIHSYRPRSAALVATQADGKGRSWEQIWEDPEWCEKLEG